MSDTSADTNLRAILARIDRDLAETGKLIAEQRKLLAEERKLDRDRFLAPALAVTGLIGGIITIIGFVLQHWFGR